MAWAKLHTDILGDPKLMRAARKGARELLYLPWFIAFAKLADDGGRLSVGGEPADAVDMSDLIPGATARAVSAALSSLVSIGVLVKESDGALCFTRWDVRSEAKPSDSASAIGERVRKHRAKQRNADSGALLETPGNALHVTPSNAADVTLDNATEKKRGEEKRGDRALPPRAPDPAWLPRVRERWEDRVGATTPAELKRWLAAPVEAHGEPVVLDAIDEYAEGRTGARSVQFFAKDIVQWIAKARADDAPLVENGWLTTAGERATR